MGGGGRGRLGGASAVLRVGGTSVPLRTVAACAPQRPLPCPPVEASTGGYSKSIPANPSGQRALVQGCRMVAHPLATGQGGGGAFHEGLARATNSFSDAKAQATHAHVAGPTPRPGGFVLEPAKWKEDPPPPPGSDRRFLRENIKFCRRTEIFRPFFGTQTLGSQTPPPPYNPPSKTSSAVLVPAETVLWGNVSAPGARQASFLTRAPPVAF